MGVITNPRWNFGCNPLCHVVSFFSSFSHRHRYSLTALFSIPFSSPTWVSKAAPSRLAIIIRCVSPEGRSSIQLYISLLLYVHCSPLGQCCNARIGYFSCLDRSLPVIYVCKCSCNILATVNTGQKLRRKVFDTLVGSPVYPNLKQLSGYIPSVRVCPLKKRKRTKAGRFQVKFIGRMGPRFAALCCYCCLLLSAS